MTANEYESVGLCGSLTIETFSPLLTKPKYIF